MSKQVDNTNMANPLNLALEWVLHGTTGMPRALGMRFDPTHSILNIKKLEGGSVVEELHIKGLRELRKMISDLDVVKENGGMEPAKEQ